MRKLLIVLSALLVLGLAMTACTTATPTENATPAPVVIRETAVPVVAAATATSLPKLDCTGVSPVTVRWFIGLGTGTDPAQLLPQATMVSEFNASQCKVIIKMEVLNYDAAKDVLSTEIAAGSAPDIIGPVGFSGSNTFFGQYLDIAPFIKSSGFDTSVFNAALLKMYEGAQGTVGLPFAVYPSALFYNTALFDAAGLEYPPAKYGDQYKMPDGSMVDWSWDNMQKVAQLLTLDAAGKNSTEAGFDKTKITQYGYTWQFEGHPQYWGSYWQSGSMIDAAGKTATPPDAWKASWKWTYTGIWGDQPWMASQPVEASADFGSGNPFNSGKIAMTDEPVWYTCCMGNVKTWDAGTMPSYNGKPAGRVDADTFRIWKGTKNPDAAFAAVAYMVTTGIQRLIIGSADMAPAYGAVPARTSDLQTWLDAKKLQFPWVKNWQTLLDGLNYPDVPSAESYTPNFSEAWNRGNTFSSLIRSQGGLDIDKEIQTYITDLTAIYAK
jgi:multiple sugar transport system substrate-binding protein